ncbi:MAG TPA: ATP-binding protein [Pseudobdellovibrionaceae bacterium]|jgi:signal transduction histidine kinase
MKRHRVRLWLILSLMTMVAIPLAGAYFQIQDVLNSSFSMGSEAESIEALEMGQTALKELAKKSPASEQKYHEQFLKIQELKLSLAEHGLIRQGLVNSYTFYFLVSFILMMLISIGFAVFLSRKVARAYDQSFEELVRQRDRSQFLEGMARWQDVAKQLAHEIKNPLQPIGTWMRNLVAVFPNQKKPEDFSMLLDEAAESIHQEIHHLQSLVDAFTQFSRLPEAQFNKVDLGLFVREFQQRYQESWDVDWQLAVTSKEALIQADVKLLRQVLANLITNAVEANCKDRIVVHIQVAQKNGHVELVVENSGKVIEAALKEKIFEPYFSTKSAAANFGLGLAIVRKIVFDHGGDINVEDCFTGARFKLTFPLIGEGHG